MAIICYALFATMLAVVIIVNIEYSRRPKVAKLFCDGCKLDWRYMSLFSVSDISKAIIKCFDINYCNIIYLKYGDIEFHLNYNMTVEQIADVINNCQEAILSRYEDDLKRSSLPYDIIIYIWLLYSNKMNYRKNFYRILSNMCFENNEDYELKSEILEIFYFG